MKYSTQVVQYGEAISLKLGLNHAVTFPKDASVEEIVTGVNSLVETVTGVPVFKMVEAVLKEQEGLGG